MASNFLQALHSNRVVLMDGAMGTELQGAGMNQGECHELWNLMHPDRVLAIHRAYAEAGAEVLLTNTFQVNPAALAKQGLENRLESMCQEAARLASQACRPDGFVLGDIGPWDGPEDVLKRMATALGECDGLLLETISDLEAARHFREVRGEQWVTKPLLVSVTYLHNAAGEIATIHGQTPEQIAQQAAEIGVTALGVNCGREIDMDDVIEIVRRYRSVTDLPLFARPNAGTPTQVNGQWVYPRTPEQMAAKLPELLAAGVSMVGGCCGTTPAHIAAFRRVIDDWNAKSKAARPR